MALTQEQKDALRAKKAQKKRDGICINCTRPARRGRVTCETCKQNMIKSNRKIYKRKLKIAKAKGLCNLCFKLPTMPDSTSCEGCFLRRKERNSDYNIQLRADRRDMGLCTKCGDLREDKTRRWCKGCRDRHREIPIDYVTKHAQRKANALKYGLCTKCFNPRHPVDDLGFRLCKKCRARETTRARDRRWAKKNNTAKVA